jgi:hypothetical protein
MNNPLKYVDQDGNEPITLTTAGVASAGVITIALVGHTYNYVTNPAYRKNYDSFVSSAANVAVKAAEDTWNAVTSLFSSEESNKENNQNNEQTKDQSNKKTSGLERQLKEHENKLEEYTKNPDASDNKGHLKNAKSPEQRKKIIQGRIKNLKKQIDNFKKQIDAKNNTDETVK